MTRWVHTTLIGAALVLAGCASNSKSTSTSNPTSTGASAKVTTPAPATPAGNAGDQVTLPSGLKYTDNKVGDGALAENGKTVSVHYTGWLMDGTKFDSSLDRGEPFPFQLGSGMVIKGWEEGIKGMRVGGKRTLVIPPDLGYGSRGTPGGPIPPDATLKFDVELMGVK